MLEIFGDLFSHNETGPDAICITTNGFVNTQGANTMGRGCAGEAKYRWPGVQMLLGRAIQNEGNNVHLLTTKEKTLVPGQGWGVHHLPYHLISFPVKPERVDDAEELLPHYQQKYQGHEEDLGLPGWMSRANRDLIYQSCCQLKNLADAQGFSSVVLPRPGCGAGGLSWEDEVRPLCQATLDDRFFVINFK